VIESVVRLIYTAVLGGAALYALHIIVLIVLFLIHGRKPSPALPAVSDDALPVVTVQLPLRNERWVARDAMRALAALDWPRDRLEIQVLDDSEDETSALVDEEAQRLRTMGVDLVVRRRDQPTGYKAGALAEGCQAARGAFFAVFDADFQPSPDFLRRTVPYLLADRTLGMVQARWTYFNAAHSWVTRVQALALDAHFAVEQVARNRAGLCSNANGSATVWRREAIEAAGGWQGDTVTEDLDLSYRLQLAGWRALYLPEVVAPSELPTLIAAFRSQQARWAKGAIQCLRKLTWPILCSRRLHPGQKIMGLLHLSGYVTQVVLLVMMLLTVPMVLVSPTFPRFVVWLGAVVSIPPVLFVLGQWSLYRDWLRRILFYPLLMLVWIGIAWRLTLAVFDGLLHWAGPFERTPKFGAHGRQPPKDSYLPRPGVSSLGELALAVYAAAATWLALSTGQGHLAWVAGAYALGNLLVWAGMVWQARSVLGQWLRRDNSGRCVR